MGKILTERSPTKVEKGSRLNIDEAKFKIALECKLHNNYCFKKLKQSEIKGFHIFLEETVYKNLTITQVDKLYLRTKGDVLEEVEIDGEKRTIVHYGKDRKPFMVFGYYNYEGYFVIYRIDPKHNVHKE